MLEVAWREVNQKNQVVIKTKEFKTERAQNKFASEVSKKDNFVGWYGITDDEGEQS